MPFVSDKQRRYLWSQKPEVAKKFAKHHEQGGQITDSWWNKRMAGAPQHRSYSDDPDDIYETVLEQDPYGGKYLRDDVPKPAGYYDLADYYIPKYRQEVDEAALRAANNAAIAERAKEIGFQFNEGGSVPMDNRKPAKVTQKDRYGNQVTYEYTPEVKPLDPTKLAEKAMEQGVDGIGIDMPQDHPGEPRGTDTVPAWLTPGEFVVNAEAARMYGPEIEAMNNQGKAQQQMQGGSIPGMSSGGHVDYHGGPHHPDQVRDHEMHSNHMMYQGGGPVPFLAGPLLTDPEYMFGGGGIPGLLNVLQGKPSDDNRGWERYHKKRRWEERHKDDSSIFDGLGDKIGKGIIAGGAAIGSGIKSGYDKLREMEEATGTSPYSKRTKSNNTIYDSPHKEPEIEELSIGQKNKELTREDSPKWLKDWYNKWGETQNLNQVQDQLNKYLKQENPKHNKKIMRNMLEDINEFRHLYKNEGGWITDSLLDRLAEVESGGNNDAVSPVGAIGMYQWMPKSARKAGYGVKPFDPLDPKEARKATAKYLKNMQKYHGFTPEETLRAYNWGPGNVIKHKKGTRKDIPAEALNYPGKILGIENTQGVPAPAGMPLPIPRPPQEMPPMPTPRPQPIPQEASWLGSLWDSIKGPRYQDEGGPIQSNFMERVYGEGAGGNPNVVAPLTDVPKGHKMFGGDETMAGNVFDQNAAEKEEPWYAPLLGHKSKDALGLELSPNEKRLYHEANPSLVGDDPSGADIPAEIGDVETATVNEFKDPMENALNKMQVDDFKEYTKTPEGKGTAGEAIADGTAENNTKETGEVQTGPGSDQAGDNKTDDEVKLAGEKTDNSFKSAALSALKGAFGDLFDKKELARMAIMYAGSRALGYSHGGSLQYAAKNYVQRVDAKVESKNKQVQELIKGGKYDVKSIQAFKESGNISDLVPAAAPQNRTGEYKTFYAPGGQQVKAEKVKIGKSSYWMVNGKPIDGRKFNENPANVKGTKEWQSKFNNYKKETASQLKELKDTFGAIKTDKGTTYKTDILPTTSAHKIAEWADKNGVEPNQLQGLVESAYHDAVNDKRQDGSRARDLTPYLNQLIIRQKTGVPDAFVAKGYEPGDGPKQYINASKLQLLNANASRLLKNNNKRGDTQDLANQYYTAAIKDWNALSTEEQTQYNREALDDENGFYVFAQEKINKYIK